MDNFWEEKRVLVTGEEDFLGRYVVEKLQERGVRKEHISVPSQREHDLTTMEDCQRVVKGKNIIINLGGVMGGIAFNRKYPGKAFFENAAKALHLLEVCRQEKVEKFVGLGSVCSYPKFTPVPFQEENLWQGYPEETNASYGLAKKFMLVQSQAYHKEYGLNAIHLLLTNVYGPGENFDPETSHVIPALIRKIDTAKSDRKEYIELWGSGKVSREFIYVEDAAEAIVLAAERYNKPAPVNIGSGKEVSLQELAEVVCRVMDFKGKIRWDTTKPDGQPRRCLDVLKAEKEFGFQAETNLEKGLEKIIHYYYEEIKQ